MLPREHRITSGEDFRAATRNGRRAGSRTLVAHLLVTTGAQPPRVGFVVSKAVGPAVTRNRVKRRLRHIAREQIPSLPGSAVLVIRALPASADASYADLAADFASACARVAR